MNNDIGINDIYTVLSGVLDKDFKYQLDDSNVSLVKQNNQFSHYFFNGISDGSGGMYPFMTELCKTFSPKHVVELGNREGMGILSIYEGMKKYNGLLTTIDHIKNLKFIPENIKNSEKVNYIFGDVLKNDTVEKVKANGKIDMILMDTIHTEEQLRSEWNLYEPLFNDTCIVLVDDLYYKNKHVFYDTIMHEKFIDYKLHSTGFGVVLYKRNKQ